MTGPKRNEGATVAGERPGTRAVARYVRVSASKARQVLDLIRGMDVQEADAVLRFTEREVARDIRKLLASAVANAEGNDNQAREELKVSACFADEGPTLKRFRPRARGRAMRIRKRTCHITIVVDRMSDEELELKRRREEARRPAAGRRGQRAAARQQDQRRARVAASRRAQAAAKGATPATGTPKADEAGETPVDRADDSGTVDTEVEPTTDERTDAPEASEEAGATGDEATGTAEEGKD
jgi:large subunit ribosomal protein L22